MIDLTKHKYFKWAAKSSKGAIFQGQPIDDLAKISVGMETFWVSKCKPARVDGRSGFIGIIDNHLTDTANHGLRFGDEVFFVPEDEE